MSFNSYGAEETEKSVISISNSTKPSSSGWCFEVLTLAFQIIAFNSSNRQELLEETK